MNELNSCDLSFIVTLGDMIDHNYTSLDEILPVLEKSKAPTYKAIGNHDFDVDEKYKSNVRSRLNNKNGYFDFLRGDFLRILLCSGLLPFSHIFIVLTRGQYNIYIQGLQCHESRVLHDVHLRIGSHFPFVLYNSLV